MLNWYYTLIKYEPHLSSGALRQKQCRVKSKSNHGALLATLKIAKSECLNVRKIEVHPDPIPVSRKNIQNKLNQRQAERKAKQQTYIDALMNVEVKDTH